MPPLESLPNAPHPQQEKSERNEPKARKERLILMDASGYLFRAFFALPPLSRSDGLPVGAVYGFVSVLLKAALDYRDDHIVCIFDEGRHSFRNELYPEYKAHRPEPPEDLVPQFALVRKAAEAFGFPTVGLKGFEADDLIATYAKQGLEAGFESLILSSDKDLMQLVCDGVAMFDPVKNRPVGLEEIHKKFGVTPDKVIEVQALIGDSSDNVPGVPGIGPKGAAELILQYGNLETLLDHIEEIKAPKRRESLSENADLARISKVLVTLRDDVPLSLKPTELPDRHKQSLIPTPAEAEVFLLEMEFQKLLARYGHLLRAKGPESGDGAVVAAGDSTGTVGASCDEQKGAGRKRQEADYRKYVVVFGQEELEPFLMEAQEAGLIAIDTETTDRRPAHARLVGISLAVAGGRACYLPLRHLADTQGVAEDLKPQPLVLSETSLAMLPNAMTQGMTPDLFDLPEDVAAADPVGNPPPVAAYRSELELAPGQWSVADALSALRPLLEDPAILKVGQNIKYDLTILHQEADRLRQAGCPAFQAPFRIQPIEDTMLLSFVLDAGRGGHGLDNLSETWLGITPIKFNDVAGIGKKRKRFDQIPIEEAFTYAAEDADLTYRLRDVLRRRLHKEHLVTVYERIDRNLPQVTSDMERTGIRIDRERLAGLGREFSERIAQLETQIHELAGKPFHIASTRTLGKVLFEQLNLSSGRKTKTGIYATSVSDLEPLAEHHPIIGKVLEWRGLSKLRSTYMDSLEAEAIWVGGNEYRVHTSYSLVGAQTGRFSSSDPNLQNIPVRTEDGQKIRSCFIAADGCDLLSLDYSQIELRLAAEMSGDEAMIQAFLDDADIHQRTAARIFSVAPEAVTADQRRSAKAVNFGVIYGISAHGLARQTGTNRQEAAEFIARYFREYPALAQSMERFKEACRKDGYVETLFGRRIHFPGLKNAKPMVRAGIERAAINAPLQGTAADIIKRAMIRIPDALARAGLKGQVRMLLQVHDELLFEVRSEVLPQAIECLRQPMENAAKPARNLRVPLTVDHGIGRRWDKAHGA